MMSDKNQFVVAVVGGGAAGLMSAVAAASESLKENKQVRVVVLERLDRVGKKILATGNGRCNFTNLNASEKNYHSVCNETKHIKSDFVTSVFERFSVSDTLLFFKTLGILSAEEENGKIFPYSRQAAAVLDVLRFEAERLNVEIRTGFDTKKAEKKGSVFKITSYKNETLTADRLIVAAGGCAYSDLGSNGSGFDILQSFGHKITKRTPALVQLVTASQDVKGLRGIKFNGNARCIVSGREVAAVSGEILFTDYGLSGPPIFELSTLYPMYNDMTVRLDFMPEYSIKEVETILLERRKFLKHLTAENFFTGLLNKRIGNVILQRSGVEKLSLSVARIDDKIIRSASCFLKGTDFKILKTNGWKNAQVTAGGVRIDEFSADTLKSKVVDGLYAAGEVFDIYGDCGGYNLQWAWSSGRIAALSAVESLLNKKTKK